MTFIPRNHEASGAKSSKQSAWHHASLFSCPIHYPVVSKSHLVSGNISRSPLLMKIYRSTGSLFALAPLVGLRNNRAPRPSLTSWASETSRTAIYNAWPAAVSTSYWCSYPRDVFLISISVAHALLSITSHHRYKSEFGGFTRPHLTLFSTAPIK